MPAHEEVWGNRETVRAVSWSSPGGGGTMKPADKARRPARRNRQELFLVETNNLYVGISRSITHVSPPLSFKNNYAS